MGFPSCIRFLELIRVNPHFFQSFFTSATVKELLPEFRTANIDPLPDASNKLFGQFYCQPIHRIIHRKLRLIHSWPCLTHNLKKFSTNSAAIFTHPVQKKNTREIWVKPHFNRMQSPRRFPKNKGLWAAWNPHLSLLQHPCVAPFSYQQGFQRSVSAESPSVLRCTG